MLILIAFSFTEFRINLADTIYHTDSDCFIFHSVSYQPICWRLDVVTTRTTEYTKAVQNNNGGKRRVLLVS